MEQEFINWFKANEKRFAHGQLDEKQIAYSAWLKGQEKSNIMNMLPTTEEIENKANSYDTVWIAQGFKQGAEWTINMLKEKIID